MQHIRSIAIVLTIGLFSLAIQACAEGSPSITPESTTPKTPATSTHAPQDKSPGTPSPPPHPPATDLNLTPETDPIPVDNTHKNAIYILNAVLDYDRHHLAVMEEILYTNNASESLTDMLLIVEPNNYPGVFQLNALTWDDGSPVQDATWDGNQLSFPLREPLNPRTSLKLTLDYELSLPSPQPADDVRPIPFGYTARQTNLVDWYPFIPPYIKGEGWKAHHPWFYGEHLAYETADFQVNIRLAGARTDLVIAASAPSLEDGEWHHYTHSSARNFAWSVSHQYQVNTGTVDGIIVKSYAFPFDTKAGDAVLQTTVEALSIYQDIFGPYPRELLSVVEADFLDGMEFDGLYFLSGGFYNLYQGGVDEYLIAIAAHETAHQWWYGLVGNDQALEPWLDEALCTYSERLYYEQAHPEALDWWWQYRIYYSNPQGWVDTSIYEAGGYYPYRNAVYLNGALFIEELRSLIGDTAFYAFLKDYTLQHSHQLVSGDDFFSVLDKHTQADWQTLLKKYFQQSYKIN